MKFQFIRKNPTIKQKIEILKKLDLQSLKSTSSSAIIRDLDEYEIDFFSKKSLVCGVMVYLDESRKTKKNKHGLTYVYLNKEMIDRIPEIKNFYDNLH